MIVSESVAFNFKWMLRKTIHIINIVEVNGSLQLLLLVGAKLEHIIVRLTQDVGEMKKPHGEAAPVKPSDEYFWFNRPRIILDFIHFILFQNAFEIAFFFWILVCHITVSYFLIYFFFLLMNEFFFF